MFRKTALILLILTTVAFSQSRRHSKMTLSKFGMAAGFSVNYFMPELDGVNEKLTLSGLPEFSSGLVTYGGGGYVYVLFVRNLRIGGLGYGGSSTVSSGNRSARLQLSGGGLTVEYTLPQITSFALSFGAIIGGGKMSLDLYETDGAYSWDEIWTDYNSSTQSKHVNVSSSYFLLSPTVNAEVMLNRFTTLRLGCGYQFALGESWDAYGGEDLTGVPSNFGGSGFFATVGVLVGLFVF
jgi:hypothetical protein